MLAMVLGLAGAAVAPQAAGAADRHQVAVTPSTGLTDAQTVTVSGSGFVESPFNGGWAVSMCSSAVLDSPLTLVSAVQNCDVTSEPFVLVDADGAGNISTPFVVHETFEAGLPPVAPTHTVTCGSAPNDCAVLVAQATEDAGFVGAAVPITFGPPTVQSCIAEFGPRPGHDGPRSVQDLVTCVLSAIRDRR